MGPDLEVELHVGIPGDYTLRTAHEIKTELIDGRVVLVGVLPLARRV